MHLGTVFELFDLDLPTLIGFELGF